MADNNNDLIIRKEIKKCLLYLHIRIHLIVVQIRVGRY